MKISENRVVHLGLITPTMLAVTKIQKLPLIANTTPLTLIRNAPAIRTFLLPKPSAKRVRKKLMTTSPRRVNVMNRPMRASDTSRLDRYKARISVEVP